MRRPLTTSVCCALCLPACYTGLENGPTTWSGDFDATQGVTSNDGATWQPDPSSSTSGIGDAGGDELGDTGSGYTGGASEGESETGSAALECDETCEGACAGGICCETNRACGDACCEFRVNKTIAHRGAWKESGLPENSITINVWTVNDAARMQSLIDAGVDFITTDDPEVLLELSGST